MVSSGIVQISEKGAEGLRMVLHELLRKTELNGNVNFLARRSCGAKG